MYVPDIFALDDPQRIAEVIARFNFALLVTALPGKASGQASGRAPTATHLPFLYDAERGPHGTLIAHMAKANPHWRDFAGLAEAGGEALVVFWGPHAYVSPSWYGPGDAVPTWNYIAVHAYGTPRPIADAAEVRAMLERLVATHEAGAAAPRPSNARPTSTAARPQRTRRMGCISLPSQGIGQLPYSSVDGGPCLTGDAGGPVRPPAAVVTLARPAETPT